jgi:ferrous iron transport protein B
VGHPNVGKSVIFQKLTGQHAIVSNYPGTTVEILRAHAREQDNLIFVDTPGVVAFPPQAEDERVTERVLLFEPLAAVIQVGDAKNLRRTLLLTIQLAEMGLPLILALNMMDEAEAYGVEVDYLRLAEHLSIPVIPTIAVRAKGISDLRETIQRSQPPQFRLQYPAEIENAVAAFCSGPAQVLRDLINISLRSLALLWLSGDLVVEQWLADHLDASAYQDERARREALQLSFVEPLAIVIQQARLEFVDKIAASVVRETEDGASGFAARLGRLATHPVWGWFILAGTLYLLYWFVGIFGAGTLVGLLEEDLFGKVINPWFTDFINRLIPWPLLADLIVGEYGLWTMGMTYALALILPIVTTFFLAFSVMEDSGYLPRLAALSNRLFQKLGLNGKAVLPMILGLGCVTMATLTTRVLENKRDRFLVTLLLALAVPCSAQLGVVMGMLAGISFSATLIWGGVVILVFLTVGWLAARLVPGERTSLLVELPPIRWPMISNVVLKTLARLEWYLKEVVPLFLLGTALLFLLDKLSILDVIIRISAPLVEGWLGLPSQASAAFLVGFLRRDFGATGLFVMESRGLLSPLQVVVAMVTITLFIPCIASVMMIAKEHSWGKALGMLLLIMPLAFLTGGVLNLILRFIGWGA